MLTIPDDIPRFEVGSEARETSSVIVKQDIFPHREDLEKAKDLIGKAESPVILAGRGTHEMREELLAFAEKSQHLLSLRFLERRNTG